METCMTMGTDECPSRLLAVENVPEFLDNKEDGTPDMLWVEGVLNESNQYETMEGN